MKTKYDWSKAHHWAQFIATDEGGTMWQFSEKPIHDHECWYLKVYSPDHLCKTFEEGHCSAFSDDNWQDSLEERPK